MRSMKDSGIIYLGDIPKQWTITPAKHVLVKQSKPVRPDDSIVICSNKGKVVYRGDKNLGLVSMTENGYQAVDPGDLLIHGMDTWHGAIAVSEIAGKCTGVVHVCESNQDKRYIAYYLQMLAFRNVYKAFSNGVRQNTSDFRSWQKAGEISLLLPSVEEQKALADYLDDKCSEIDAAILAAEASIDEYEHYRKSIIFHSVTKGLDVSAEMKESGIDWVGAIPASWNVARFKHHYCLVSESGHETEQLLSVYLNQGVIRYSDSDGSQVHKPSATLEKYQLVNPGNLVLNNQQSWRGSLGVSFYRGIISPAYHVFRAINPESLDCEYANYLFRYALVPYFDMCSRGVGSIQRCISVTDFNNVACILIPPYEVQRNIANFVKAKSAEIDSAVSAKQGIIEELKTYKKSLIYEVVTGKREI